jgi:DNA invertase Pin-like site-specific DNA recombinase
LDDSQRSEVVLRYENGEPGAALANEFGIHRATLFNIVQRAGLTSRYNILSNDDIHLAESMYEAGQSLATIADHFGVSDGTVLYVFRKLEIRTRRRGTNQRSQKPLS